MLSTVAAFSGFSVLDLEKAKQFYNGVLGLELSGEQMGLQFKLPGGGSLFIYDKQDHEAASFTVLNFVVENIDQAVDELVDQGVSMEIYDNMPAPQDNKGIARGLSANMGPDVAWFKDPSGNILAVMQDK
jgi:predicted enzyme related to lactoylglutathione lyase